MPEEHSPMGEKFSRRNIIPEVVCEIHNTGYNPAGDYVDATREKRTGNIPGRL